MKRTVDPTEQLVVEILVRDIKRSTEFYRGLGFELLRDADDFVELAWEGHHLYLAEASAFRDAPHFAPPPPAEFPVANVRVMVPDVDECWMHAIRIGTRVVVPIGDRYYGLRDFLIVDPNGFGVRFASSLPFGLREEGDPGS